MTQLPAGPADRFGTMGRSGIVGNGANVAAESSFDIVSKVNRQEVDNALNQAAKEVRQRFDFKNTDASIRWSGNAIEMEANSEERVKAVLDVFQSKLVRRGVSLKAIDAGAPRSSGKLYKIIATTKEGISQENAKKVSKLIRDEGPRSVRAQIQGDELRVSSKSRDDLQKVQALVKAADLDFAVQFTNYR
jgi:cyclic-di-GMP-binding protein